MRPRRGAKATRARVIDRDAAIGDPAAAQTLQQQAKTIVPDRGPEVSGAAMARLPCDILGVRRGLAAAMLFAGDAGIGDAAADKLAIVVEEWLINVVEHGGAAHGSRIILRLQRLDRAVRVTVTDAGCAFDPRPVEFAGPNEVRGGGAGLALIKAWSQITAYSRRAGRNRLVLEMPL